MSSESQSHTSDTSSVHRVQELETYIVDLHEVVRDLQAMTGNLPSLAQVMIDRLEAARWRDMPTRPAGLHLLDTEPDRLYEGERDEQTGWALCCSCGWESKPTRYAETAETLGTAHLFDVGVKVDETSAVRIQQGMGGDR